MGYFSETGAYFSSLEKHIFCYQIVKGRRFIPQQKGKQIKNQKFIYKNYDDISKNSQKLLQNTQRQYRRKLNTFFKLPNSSSSILLNPIYVTHSIFYSFVYCTTADLSTTSINWKLWHTQIVIRLFIPKINSFPSAPFFPLYN